MAPKREWIQPIRNGFRLMLTHIAFPGSSAMGTKAAFYHHGDTLCHPKAGYVTTKLHGTSTCRCNNNAIFSESNFHGG